MERLLCLMLQSLYEFFIGSKNTNWIITTDNKFSLTSALLFWVKFQNQDKQSTKVLGLAVVLYR